MIIYSLTTSSRMEFVSNNTFTDSEFDKWKETVGNPLGFLEIFVFCVFLKFCNICFVIITMMTSTQVMLAGMALPSTKELEGLEKRIARALVERLGDKDINNMIKEKERFMVNPRYQASTYTLLLLSPPSLLTFTSSSLSPHPPPHPPHFHLILPLLLLTADPRNYAMHKSRLARDRDNALQVTLCKLFAIDDLQIFQQFKTNP